MSLAAARSTSSIEHISKIDLSHIPLQYTHQYRNLPVNTRTFFLARICIQDTANLLMPHVVRLKDPNRITSISQYKLPHKLKEVGIDYVQKLLEAGVVRKSTSVFNSPLMLAKKAECGPKQTFGVSSV